MKKKNFSGKPSKIEITTKKNEIGMNSAGNYFLFYTSFDGVFPSYQIILFLLQFQFFHLICIHEM